MSLDIASCFIAADGVAVGAGGIAVAAAAPPEPGVGREDMQSGKSSKNWGFQRPTEAMTSPMAISADWNAPRNVNLAGLKATVKASP